MALRAQACTVLALCLLSGCTLVLGTSQQLSEEDLLANQSRLLAELDSDSQGAIETPASRLARMLISSQSARQQLAGTSDDDHLDPDLAALASIGMHSVIPRAVSAGKAQPKVLSRTVFKRQLIEGPAYPTDPYNFKRKLIQGSGPSYPTDPYNYKRKLITGEGPAYPTDPYAYRRRLGTGADPDGDHAVYTPGTGTYPTIPFRRSVIAGADIAAAQRARLVALSEDNMEFVEVMDSEVLHRVMDRQLDEDTGSTGSDESDGCSPPVYGGRGDDNYTPTYGSDSGDSSSSDSSSGEGDHYVPSILPLGYCYCEPDADFGGFKLDDTVCAEALRERSLDFTAGLDGSLLDAYYGAEGTPDEEVRNLINDFLFWDCAAKPACECKYIPNMAALSECAIAIKDFAASPRNAPSVTQLASNAARWVLLPEYQSFAMLYAPLLEQWANSSFTDETCADFSAWNGPYEFLPFHDVYARNGDKRRQARAVEAAVSATATNTNVVASEGRLIVAAGSSVISHRSPVIIGAGIALVAVPALWVMRRRRSATQQLPEQLPMP